MKSGNGNIRVMAPLAAILLSCAPICYASPVSADTAQDRCKDRTLHYLKKRGLTPYNWAATTTVEGDDYVTKGVWSVDADEIKVECAFNRHAKKLSGKYKILGVEISDDSAE